MAMSKVSGWKLTRHWRIWVVMLLLFIAILVIVPMFGGMRRPSLISAFKSNLRNAATSQKAYFTENGTYTKSVNDLRVYGYQQSSNVNISNIHTTGRSFVITATLKKGCKANTGKWFLNSTDRAVITVTPCSPSRWYLWWEGFIPPLLEAKGKGKP